MTNYKRTSLLIIVCICLLVISVLVLFCRAVNQAGMPMHGMNQIQNPDAQNLPASPELFLGNERTDVVVCYQNTETQELLLWNLTYQQFENRLEIYPAQLLEPYGILPGDFAEITYTAEYSDNPDYFLIRDLQAWTELTPSEALSQADPALNQNRSADFPVQIWNSQDFQNVCYLMIPAGENYDLFQSDSDQFRQFDDYRCVSQNLEISGHPEILNNWVLCQENLTDEAIRERLQQGTVTTSGTDDLFLVGYENPEFFTEMQHSILTVESNEVRNWHLSAKQLGIPEILTDLPEAVQQDLARNWNQTDDIVVFAGNLTTDTTPGFDQDHRLIPVRGTGESAGYVIWYMPPVFFEQICSGTA
ncbi:MAG: hypothetical protein K2H29_01365 [Oscillospiraceae bacterium]|nr:hypothetical protein [Oscillospiraceae bacterium]